MATLRDLQDALLDAKLADIAEREAHAVCRRAAGEDSVAPLGVALAAHHVHAAPRERHDALLAIARAHKGHLRVGAEAHAHDVGPQLAHLVVIVHANLVLQIVSVQGDVELIRGEIVEHGDCSAQERHELLVDKGRNGGTQDLSVCDAEAALRRILLGVHIERAIILGETGAARSPRGVVLVDNLEKAALLLRRNGVADQNKAGHAARARRVAQERVEDAREARLRRGAGRADHGSARAARGSDRVRGRAGRGAASRARGAAGAGARGE